MKEAITKFDLEAAFKALDEIEVPKAGKVRANRPALNEIFSRKTKFDALMEEYYDISSAEELDDAKEAREAEVAQAKLERIEKIVDLDADSPEDLLTSYVGKYIMQCPQCMTLFYKNPEDIVEAEDDPDTVNVNEVCQHCGNESGYTLVGKVGEAEPDEMDNFTAEPELELPAEEIPEEPVNEEPTDEIPEEDLGDLEGLDLDLDLEDEEEKTEESFSAHAGTPLVEELADDSELGEKLDAQLEYIEYLQATIAQEKENLDKANNAQVKTTIQRNIDALNAELEAALPTAVIDGTATAEVSEETAVETEEPIADEISDEAIEEPTPIEEPEAIEETEPVEDTEPVEEALQANEDETLEEAQIVEGAGADAKAAANAIAKELAKDDKKQWAQTVVDVIKVIPDTFADELFDIVKQKASDIQLSLAQRNKIATSAKGKLTNDDIKDCDTVGQLLAVFDSFEWAKTNPGLLKGLLMIILAVVAILEPTPVLEIITVSIGVLPEKTVANIVAALVAATPAGFTGTAAHNIYKKYLAHKKVKVEDYKPNKKATDNEAQDEALTEETEVEVSDAEFEELINSPEFKKPISDADVRAMFAAEKEAEEEAKTESFMNDLDEIQESVLEELIANYLVEAYGNVAGFRLTECAYADNNFTVDGTIYFTSGNTRKTTYTFSEARLNEGYISMCGSNVKLGLEKQFTLTGRVENKTLITESFRRSK